MHISDLCELTYFYMTEKLAESKMLAVTRESVIDNMALNWGLLKDG